MQKFYWLDEVFSFSFSHYLVLVLKSGLGREIVKLVVSDFTLIIQTS